MCYGRDIGVRTLSLTKTWTSRRGNGNAGPDWLIGIRRGSIDGAGTGTQVAYPNDIEMEVGSVSAVRPDRGTERGEESLQSTPSVPEPVVVDASHRPSSSASHAQDVVNSARARSSMNGNALTLSAQNPAAAEGPEERASAGSISVDHDYPPSNRSAPVGLRPPPSASPRGREQSPARSVRSLRFAGSDVTAGDRRAPSGAQIPRSTSSSTEDSAEGPQTMAPPRMPRLPRLVARTGGIGHKTSRLVGANDAGVNDVERPAARDADCGRTTLASGMAGRGTGALKVILNPGRTINSRAGG